MLRGGKKKWTCPQNCGGVDLTTDMSAGTRSCTICGFVVEDGMIVAETTFSESRGGPARTVGSTVGADGTSYGSSANKSAAVENGKRRIAQLGGQVTQFQADMQDRATAIFKMAVEKKFTLGRRTDHVAAACMYIVCRHQKTSHLLLDFAEAVNCNVFVLGQTFVKLLKTVYMDQSLAAVDPALIVPRFAGKMELGSKVNEVGKTAVRLVNRMKRDWMVEGRRPTGICGAALLIAARMHGFNRSQREMVDIVRVCGWTLRARLEEFEEVGAAAMSVGDFFNGDVDDIQQLPEADPPSFKRSMARAAPDLDDAAVARAAIEAESLVGEFAEVDAEENASLSREIVPVATAAPAKSTAEVRTVIKKLCDKESLSDLEGDEIVDEMILGEADAEVKRKIWTETHKEFLATQKEKEELLAHNEALGLAPPKTRKRKAKGQKVDDRRKQTIKDAEKQLLRSKKGRRVSSRISYTLDEMADINKTNADVEVEIAAMDQDDAVAEDDEEDEDEEPEQEGINDDASTGAGAGADDDGDDDGDYGYDCDDGDD